MPFPLSKVQRFSDYDGFWWLCAECRCCQHAREIPAEFFARLCGRRALVAAAAKRLCCARCKTQRCRCGAKDLVLMVRIKR